MKSKWMMVVGEDMEVLVKDGENVGEGEVLAESQKVKVARIEIPEKLRIELDKRKGEIAVEGEEWLSKKGVFGGEKILWPMTGKFLGINEEGVAEFEVKNRAVKQIEAPVSGKAIVENEKVGVGFEAEEVPCETVVEGKVWGRGLAVIKNWKEIDEKVAGKFGLMEEYDRVALAKARALGLAGLITRSSDKIEVWMPTVRVDESSWKKLENGLNIYGKIWLNTGKSRLLLVKNK